MKGNAVLAMLIASVYLRDVPMSLRDKTVICLLILQYIDLYVKTELDLIWVNNQLKQMEASTPSDDDAAVVIRGSDQSEWDRSSDV